MFQELFTVTVPFKFSTKRRYRLAHTFASIIGNQNEVSFAQCNLYLPSITRSKYTNLSIILANYYNLCQSRRFVLHCQPLNHHCPQSRLWITFKRNCITPIKLNVSNKYLTISSFTMQNTSTLLFLYNYFISFISNKTFIKDFLSK